MATAAELWYIRLPDGRVLRARNTESLRRYLKTGRIPWESRVRRSPDDPWQTLDQAPDFADLVPADNAGAEEASAPDIAPQQKSRTAPDLRTLGVRGLVDELCNALDSSLQPAKLNAAGATGLGIGITLLASHVTIFLFPDWTRIVQLATAGVLLVLFNICTSIVTQMTALELSRFRSAQFSEVRGGIFRYVVRLTCALGLVGGVILGLNMLLHWLSSLIVADRANPSLALEAIVNIIDGVRLLLEVISWPVLAIAMLLMGPIFIVEDHSILRGLREWLGMLRQHLGRIYLYQAIAFAFAAVMTVPLLAPVVLLSFGLAGGSPHSLSLGEMVPFYLLLGVALTPMLAYLLVAHVFIYLNLRYEFFYSARER